MAGGLSIDDGVVALTPTYVANGEANRTVTVSVTAGYGGYSACTWELFGPDHHPAGLALAPGVGLVDQTFTPKVAGSYIVVFTGVIDPVPALPADPTEQLTMLYEVPSAYGAPIPSPRESTESGSTEGWARKIESKLHDVSQQMGGRVLVRVKNVNATAIAKGDLIYLDGLERVSTAVENADLPNEYTTEVVWSGHPALATSVEVLTRSLAFALDDVAQNETGTFVLGGLVPWATNGRTVGDPVYVSDTATLGFATGTNTRVVGRVLVVGTNTMAAPGGQVLFDGAAPTVLTKDIVDALNGAAAPAAGNVFATMADVGGGSGTQYDWTATAPALNAGDWTLTRFNGGAATTDPPTLTSILSGQALRLALSVVNNNANVAYKAQGAGDFLHAFRFALNANGSTTLPGQNITWGILAFATDSQNPAALLGYAGGMFRNANAHETHREGAFTFGATFDTAPTYEGNGSWASGRIQTFDVFLQRVGNDYSVYGSHAGEFPSLWYTWTGVGAAACYVGLWLYAATSINSRALLLAYRSDLTAVPGYEP